MFHSIASAGCGDAAVVGKWRLEKDNFAIEEYNWIQAVPRSMCGIPDKESGLSLSLRYGRRTDGYQEVLKCDASR